MIINNRKRLFVMAGAVVLAVIVALLFINLFQVYWFISAPYEVKLAIDLLCGLFLAVSIGMLFSSDSRFNGIVFGILFGYVIWHFFPYGCIVPEALGMGFFLGIVLVVFVLVKNRFDILATSAKVFLTIAFAVIVGYLVSSFSTKSATMVPDATAAMGKITAQNTFFYGSGILVATIFFVVLMYSIVGVRGSNVFVFGPRGSGKTFFLLGLWGQMTKMGKGVPDQAIVSSDPEDRKNLRLTDLYAMVSGGKGEWKRTEYYKLSMYEIFSKKFYVSPVVWTIVDYAGEYYDKVNERNYMDSIEALGEAFEMPMDELEKRSGTLDFLKEVVDHHLDKLYGTGLARALNISTLYSHLGRSGKVIFLIDGEKLLTREGMADLSREFGDYIQTLMDLEGGAWLKIFGGKKKYALVVTKTDILVQRHPELRALISKSGDFFSLSDVSEASPEAELIEGAIFNILEKNLSFKSLVSMMNDISVSFIAVSVDPTAEANVASDGEQAPGQIVPWRFNEVIGFGS